MSTEPEQILVFGDETYPDGSNGDRVIYVALAMSQLEIQKSRIEIKRIASLKSRRTEGELRSFLANRPTLLVVIGTIRRFDVFGHDLWSRESDPELGSVSRADILWMYAFGFSVAVLAANLAEPGCFRSLEVRYDERSLKNLHSKMTEATIEAELSSLATAQPLGTAHGGSVRVRSVRSVSKPRQRGFRLEDDGICLAHMICSYADTLEWSELGGQVLPRDFTDTAKNLRALKGSDLLAER